MWAMKKIMHFNVEDRSQLDDSSIAAVMVRYYRENHPDSEIIQRIDAQNPEAVPDDANNEDPEFYPNFGGAFDFDEQYLVQAAALGDVSEDNFDEENEDMVHYLLEEVAAGNGNAGWWLATLFLLLIGAVLVAEMRGRKSTDEEKLLIVAWSILFSVGLTGAIFFGIDRGEYTERRGQRGRAEQRGRGVQEVQEENWWGEEKLQILYQMTITS
jgi:hypothetical protein